MNKHSLTCVISLGALALAMGASSPAFAGERCDHFLGEEHVDVAYGAWAGRETVVVHPAQLGDSFEDAIRRGFARGALTRTEADRLSAQLASLREAHRRALRDGRLSRGERRALDRRDDRLAADLRRQLHDNDVRGARYDRGGWQGHGDHDRGEPDGERRERGDFHHRPHGTRAL